VGCGCGRRRTTAVTSVNTAELELQQAEEQEALARDLESLRAAVYNSQSETVSAQPTG